MATTPTQLPVPSEKPQDLKFNAGKIDEFVTSFALKYIDRFGQGHYTIEGLRQLAQQAIAAFGWINVDSFQDGATLTLPNEILRWALPDGDGEYYRWDGTFPKDVPAASTPDSTGGVGPGAWVGVGDAALRAMLASTEDGSGDALIAVKQTAVGSIARTQHDVNADFISVKDFGAVGNWNSTTQSGANDTAAFQAAINALGGTIRQAGKRILRIPAGSYKITSINLPATLDFGVTFQGEGKYASIIWSDASITSPAIDSQIEFVHFDSLGLYGALKESAASADWRACFYRGKLANNNADVDVTFTNCFMGYAKDFIQAYGRGVMVDATCTVGHCGNLLNIVCSSDTQFGTGPTATLETGMRNYYLSPSRTDAISTFVTVSGTASQKDYINDVVVNCPSVTSCDRIAYFPDGTISRLFINGGSGLNSFSSGLVVGKRLIDGVINFTAAKQYNRAVISTEYINGIVDLTGPVQNLTITGQYRDVVSHIVRVGGQSSGVKIDICITNIALNGNEFMAYRDNSTGATGCIGLDINIRAFNPNVSATYIPWATGKQTDPKSLFNCFGAVFTRPTILFTPRLFISGVNQTLSYQRGSFYQSMGFVHADFVVSYTKTGSSTSEVSLSLPSTPAVEYPDFTSSFSGEAVVRSSSMKTIMRAEISLPSANVLLYKPDGTTVKEADLPTNFYISVRVRYPIS